MENYWTFERVKTISRIFMASEIPQELTDKILHELAGARNMDDIVMEVCEKTGLDWEDAEAYVNNLSTENENRITLAQSPLLVLLALGIFLVGVGIVLNELYQAYQTYLSGSQGFVLYVFVNGIGIFWNLVLGSAIIMGSLKGMENVWRAIFERLGIG
jgi:hypothetical protein